MANTPIKTTDHTIHALRRAEIDALFADHQTVMAIANHFSVSRSRIYQILAAGRAAAVQSPESIRFPMLPARLAARLEPRFPDAAAVCAANDDELLSIRQLGPRELEKLRERYPRSEPGAV